LNEAIERLRQELLSQALNGSRFLLCYDQSDLRPLPSNTFWPSRLDQQIREERRLGAPPVHSKKSVLCMKTAYIGCHETDFHFEVAICIALG